MPRPLDLLRLLFIIFVVVARLIYRPKCCAIIKKFYNTIKRDYQIAEAFFHLLFAITVVETFCWWGAATLEAKHM